MEDNQIVDLYWARSEEAITETDKKYGRYCHYIAYQILSNDGDAEEIVNDTYLKTWNTIPPNRPAPLKAYVGMISNQLALNRYEEKTAQKRGGGSLSLIYHELDECIADEGESVDMGENLDLRDALNNGVRIIVTTLQKFPVIYEEVEKTSGRNFAVIVDDRSTRIGLVAKHASARGGREFFQYFSRKTVGVGGERHRRDNAHHLPMPRGRVLAARALTQAAHRAAKLAAEVLYAVNTAKPRFFKVRDIKIF